MNSVSGLALIGGAGGSSGGGGGGGGWVAVGGAGWRGWGAEEEAEACSGGNVVSSQDGGAGATGGKGGQWRHWGKWFSRSHRRKTPAPGGAAPLRSSRRGRINFGGSISVRGALREPMGPPQSQANLVPAMSVAGGGTGQTQSGPGGDGGNGAAPGSSRRSKRQRRRGAVAAVTAAGGAGRNRHVQEHAL